MKIGKSRKNSEQVKEFQKINFWGMVWTREFDGYWDAPATRFAECDPDDPRARHFIEFTHSGLKQLALAYDPWPTVLSVKNPVWWKMTEPSLEALGVDDTADMQAGVFVRWHTELRENIYNGKNDPLDGIVFDAIFENEEACVFDYMNWLADDQDEGATTQEVPADDGAELKRATTDLSTFAMIAGNDMAQLAAYIKASALVSKYFNEAGERLPAF